MPDSTPANPAPLLPGAINTAAQAVAAHFAELPDVADVVSQLLSDAIAQRYPSLALDLSATRLATPDGKQWVFRPLLSVVQDYLGGHLRLDFSDIGNLSFYLSTHPPRRLRLPGSGRTRLDMQVIEGLIKELADTLPFGLQNALNDFWRNQAGPRRWRWMAQLLQDTLRIAALRRTDLDPQARQVLDQLVGTPDREQRVARHGAQAVFAYCLETTLRSGERSITLLGPHLVLTHPTNGTPVVLLCSPGGHIEAFPSMDALIQAWGQRQASDYHLDEVLTQRYEPDGDIFDHQAVMILNQQLEQLGALQLPAADGFAALQAHCRQLMDPTAYFLQAPTVSTELLATLRTHLPAGLKNADSTAQAAYRHYSLALASAKQRGGGRTFLTGIPDIQTFTVASLLRELQADAVRLEGAAQADVTALDPNQLELTFAISAGYPGTVGITQHERMSLTDLAINNLSARPSGEMSITHRAGLTVPSWLTADYLTGSNGLIERVDIGLHYPRLLEQQLLASTDEARRRETLFADQLAVQLPLLALELSLRGANGMTRDGARRVAALMALAVADQQGVVIRHLALLRHPAASPDVVTNMFLIEAQDIASGPHILYRPLYAQALLEFPSREALLEAIASPGEVQNSVLLWMSDSARPVYANGGFRQPHYLRFGQGDEFSPLRTPGPATLSEDGLNDELHQCLITGRLMQYLYSNNARALVAQADRESVSNRESRWKLLLEGGGLLFSGVLYPLLRGPLLLTTWLGNLYSSLQQDIQGLNALDAQTQELASVDLLLNLGLSLFEGPPLPVTAITGAVGRRPALPLPRQDAERWPAPPMPRIHPGSVALPGVLPGTDTAVLDFSFAQSHLRLTASQRARLNSYSTTPPRPVPAPMASGPSKGLYRFDNR
ncbi:dermonecrotic toxin domain-containing protein [Pseudomonas rhodesiae]|uniref:dermonecrotic toxin domain-containing protein n=1 Tax=Pseudomonas rhodesiae TaxID=76760 RepID=UPI0032B11884